VDNAAGAQLYLDGTLDLSSDLTVGQLYKLVFDAKVSAGTSLAFRLDPVTGSNIEIDPITNTEFQTYTLYFTASHVDGDRIYPVSMSTGEIIWLDNITIQAVTSPADFADTGNLVVVTDGGGDKAYGYIGEAGTGETLGSEILTNPSFDADTTGWNAGNSSILASVVGGVSNNSLRITEDGAASPYAFQDKTQVANKQYKVSAWVKQGTESTYELRYDPSTYSNVIDTGESTASWEYKEVYGVAFDTTERLRMYLVGAGAATTIFFDEASWKEVTEPNPNSVKIYTTQALATEGFAIIEDGFDPNDITTFEIYDNVLEDTQPRTYTATSGATATIPAEAGFNDKGLVNIVPITNWLLQSNGFDQAVWVEDVTETQDETDIAGDANTAWTVEDDNAAAVESIKQTIAKSTSDSDIYTVSLFIKKDSTTNRFPELFMQFAGVSTKNYNVQIDTSTGAVNERVDTAGNTSYEVIDKGDWWKFILHASDNGANTSFIFYIYPARGKTLGASEASATGSIIICHAMLTKTPYALPFHIPTTTVPVTTTAQTVNWTMSTVFKGLLSDAVNGTESEGTLIVSWTPYHNEVDVANNNVLILGISSGTSGLLYRKGDSLIKSYDGTIAANVSLVWVKNTTYYLIVRWSKRRDDLQVSVIDAGTLANGTATAYDDAFALGTDLIIGYSNSYPFSIKEIVFFNAWLTDIQVKGYPDNVLGGRRRRNLWR
jgi:hypothetical protein